MTEQNIGLAQAEFMELMDLFHDIYQVILPSAVMLKCPESAKPLT